MEFKIPYTGYVVHSRIKYNEKVKVPRWVLGVLAIVVILFPWLAVLILACAAVATEVREASEELSGGETFEEFRARMMEPNALLEELRFEELDDDKG